MTNLFKQKAVIQNVWLPKSMSVSIYGKFAQKDDEGETGNLFNPLYADLITSRTKMQMADYALMMPEHVCLIAADGLTLDAPLPVNVLSSKFGGLRLAHCAQGVIVGNNVCTIEGKHARGDWRPGRFDWLWMLKKFPDKAIYNLEWQHVPLMKEGVKSPEAFEGIGVFGKAKFDFDINFDRKRAFLSKPKLGGDLLKHVYESIPWEVGMAKRRTELWELSQVKEGKG
jgi:hypothetical protein